MYQFSLLRSYDPHIHFAFIVPVGHYRFITEDMMTTLDARYVACMDFKELIEYCFNVYTGLNQQLCSTFRREQALRYLRFCGKDIISIVNDPSVMDAIEDQFYNLLEQVCSLFKDYMLKVLDNNNQYAFKLAGWVDPSSILLLRQNNHEYFPFTQRHTSPLGYSSHPKRHT